MPGNRCFPDLISIVVANDEYRNCICITREDDSEETLNLAITTAFAQLGVNVVMIFDIKE